MQRQRIDFPIAERTLKLGQRAVRVTIGKPEKFKDNEDWYCPYCITSSNNTKFSYAGGVDSIQAVQLAFKKIGSDLNQLESKSGHKIQWLDMEDTGFP